MTHRIPSRRNFSDQPGFSLAELLITLAIMGILMAFTVPGILQAQGSTQSSKYSSFSKDVAFMIMNAYEQYRQANTTVATNTTPGALSAYMNFVSVDTSTTQLVDGHPGTAVIACSASAACLKLHNGGVLQLQAENFNGSTTLNTIQFRFDPDGTYTGRQDSIQFELYYDGTLKTRGNAKTNSTHSSATLSSNSSYDPAWFTGF